jgi:hypothetical protein
VRRKHSGQIDIVFIVVTPSDESTYYHASASGKLIKAARAHGTMEDISNHHALAGFRLERDYWLNWALSERGSGTQAKSRVPIPSRGN